MISGARALQIAPKYKGCHATGEPTVLGADGLRVSYDVRFFNESGELHASVLVDAHSGEVLKISVYDIEPLDRDRALAYRQDKEHEALAEVRRLAKSGERVQAMKLWRTTFGGSLRDARRAIDRRSS